MDISSKISKVKNYRKISDSEYQLQAAWTSSDMVEMNNGNSLEKELENLNTDIDNKLSALETNIDWKETVETYDDIATIYPNPEDGWTVNTKDNNITYRYNGSEWVAISANAIPKATDKVDGLMTKEYAKKLDGLTKYTPDGTTITADEDGTLHGADTIQVDGITITRDDATKVIALAKTLQDKIGTIDNKVDQNYVVNNLTTTEQGFVLDGRQGKALQDQITSLNGSKADQNIFSHDDYISWMQTPLRENKYLSRVYATFNEPYKASLGVQTVGSNGIESDFVIASSRYGFIPLFLDRSKDLNDVIGNYFIQAYGSKNSPKSGVNFYGFNISWIGDNDFAFQLLIAPNEEQISGSKKPRMYMRSKNAGTWTGWNVITGTLLS